MSVDMVNKKTHDSFFDEQETPDSSFGEYVLRINRCAKVVKGGRRLSFSALVVVGDYNGKVGVGLGKANEVADAIRKGGEIARKSMFEIKMQDRTIPHEAWGEFCGAKVLLKPAADGTGVIAGGGMRALLNLSGVHNVLAKSLGSSNKWNVVHATIKALEMLRTRAESEAMRGVSLAAAPAPETKAETETSV